MFSDAMNLFFNRSYKYGSMKTKSFSEGRKSCIVIRKEVTL